MRSIEELVNDAEELFHVRGGITRRETHLVTVIDSVLALACRPMMFHFHGAKIFRAERIEKRDNRIAKSDCSKRSRHGEQFNSRDGFTIFNSTAVGLICRVCVEFSACVQNDCHRSILACLLLF